MRVPQHGTAQHGAARHGTARHSAARHCTAPHSTARHGMAQCGTARHGTRMPQHDGTARHSTAWHGTTQHQSAMARRGMAQRESVTAQHTTAHHRMALHGAALPDVRQHTHLCVKANLEGAVHARTQPSTCRSLPWYGTLFFSTTMVAPTSLGAKNTGAWNPALFRNSHLGYLTTHRYLGMGTRLMMGS
jgi:hypothetical protein